MTILEFVNRLRSLSMSTYVHRQKTTIICERWSVEWERERIIWKNVRRECIRRGDETKWRIIGVVAFPNAACRAFFFLYCIPNLPVYRYINVYTYMGIHITTLTSLGPIISHSPHPIPNWFKKYLIIYFYFNIFFFPRKSNVNTFYTRAIHFESYLRGFSHMLDITIMYIYITIDEKLIATVYNLYNT